MWGGGAHLTITLAIIFFQWAYALAADPHQDAHTVIRSTPKRSEAYRKRDKRDKRAIAHVPLSILRVLPFPFRSSTLCLICRFIIIIIIIIIFSIVRTIVD